MRSVGMSIVIGLAMSCSGGTTGGPATPTVPQDPCERLAVVMCRIQGIEGEPCATLRTKVLERGPDYCTNRLPDSEAQVELSRQLLAEEVTAGEAVPERTLCPAAERTLEPTAPDPENGEFTLEQALADLPGQGNPRARIVTRLGTLDCELFADKAPHTVANFVGLARGLRPWWDPCQMEWRRGPFYDGLVFHRAIPGFMIQGGDILGNGEGDGGYEIADEFDPSLRHDAPGVMSMANSGPNTNGTQFFVTEGPTRWLNDKHSVFGRCQRAGLVARIAREPRDADDRPQTPVVLKVEIYR
jgi:peptidyl-prolyl cis-trans isomerase A (cyclophilin A)